MSKSGPGTLVVVDVQKYFVTEHCADIPAKIARYIDSEQPDQVLFTRFVTDPKSNFGQTEDSEICRSSPDIDIAPELERFTTDDNLFSKSAFSIFAIESVVSRLDKKQPLFLCGIDTECCVLASAFNAFEQNYNVKVIGDLCGSHRGEDYHQMGLQLIEKNIKGVLT